MTQTPVAELVIAGTVESGKGRSAPHHHRTDWIEYLGWTPHPGTLNLHVGKLAARLVGRLPAGTAIPTPDGEVAGWHLMHMDHLEVAVRAYRRTVEVLAPMPLREKFGLSDGDVVSLVWRLWD